MGRGASAGCLQPVAGLGRAGLEGLPPSGASAGVSGKTDGPAHSLFLRLPSRGPDALQKPLCWGVRVSKGPARALRLRTTLLSLVDVPLVKMSHTAESRVSVGGDHTQVCEHQGARLGATSVTERSAPDTFSCSQAPSQLCVRF